MKNSIIRFFISFISILCILQIENLSSLEQNGNFDEERISPGPEQKNLFVSLGSSCPVALGLRRNGLRVAAFPFDWLYFRSHEGFLKVLKEDFLFFTEKEHFNGILNSYYDILFMHDSISFDPESEMQSKYNRRINRFRQLKQYPGKVFFIKTFWTEQASASEFHENTERAKTLKIALDQYFPLLNFTLIIASFPDLNIPKMEEIDGVIEYATDRNYDSLSRYLLSLP